MKRLTNLKPNQIFVFGSNLAGIHGAGAARDAALFFGAVENIGEGPMGQSYAIPTKDAEIQTRPLLDIAESVQRFLGYAELNPNKEFIITPIGTGYAGYRHEDIAPMFKSFPANCIMPEEWAELLK